MNHVADNAELYALGMLEEAERAAVDAHARDCAACAQRLGQAEATVSDMLDTTLPSEPAPRELLQRMDALRRPPLEKRAPRRFTPTLKSWGMAAAAVFAIATGVLTQRVFTLQHALRSDGTVFTAMIASHFNHAQFVGPAGNTIAAKAIYERHGRWYQILASKGDPAWRIAIAKRLGEPATDVPERFTRRGDALIMSFAATEPIAELQLVDAAGRVVGRVHPKISGQDAR